MTITCNDKGQDSIMFTVFLNGSIGLKGNGFELEVVLSEDFMSPSSSLLDDALGIIVKELPEDLYVIRAAMDLMRHETKMFGLIGFEHHLLEEPVLNRNEVLDHHHVLMHDAGHDLPAAVRVVGGRVPRASTRGRVPLPLLATPPVPVWHQSRGVS